MADMLAPLTDPTIAALPGIRHGFFTRQGGVSNGIYASLNTGLGSADNPALVEENRTRIRAHLGADAFLTVHQHHSTLCVRTQTAWDASAAPRADAIVTRTSGLAICAQAADCGPVLFADQENSVIGCAHAGWKGALTGVLETTIEAMESEGANRAAIKAALGPCIGPTAYEVGPEFVERFEAADPSHARFFSPASRDGHSLFDLTGFILMRLKKAGVAASALHRCTYSEPDLFYSYRRATHRGEPDYGRLASAIMLTHGA